MTTDPPAAAAPPLSFLWRPHVQAPVALGAAFVLTVLGPFGTYFDLPLGPRWLYWTGLCLVNWALYVLAAEGLSRWTPAGSWRPWQRALAAAPVAMLPGTALVVLFEYLFRPALVQAVIAALPIIYLNGVIVALAIALPMTAYFALVWQRQQEAGQTAAPPAPDTEPAAAEPRFLRRIPPALGRDLLALQMEDHYLRIHTAQGSDLVLCRLSDALTELDGIDGMQVHRSYWVARAALADRRRDNGRLLLVLRNGLEVPVSRTYLAAVRDAGWLEKASA